MLHGAILYVMVTCSPISRELQISNAKCEMFWQCLDENQVAGVAPVVRCTSGIWWSSLSSPTGC